MKELSIEEKARNYDEAYKKVAVRFGSNVADEIFLKESEDEKIKKAILELVRQSSEILEKKNQEQMIAWLEKQGEHTNFRNKIQVGDQVTRNKDGVLVNLSQLKRVAKPSEKQGEQKPAWSEEDERRYRGLHNLIYYTQYCDSRKELSDWLKSIKDRIQPQPRQEWSEEDKNYYDTIIAILENTKDDAQLSDSQISFLKSLRPQINVTDEELAQAKKDAYNDALDKIEYHSGEPTFDDGEEWT